MFQISNYDLIYSYKKIYLKFKPHIKQKIYVDAHVNNYVNNSMREFSIEQLRVMRETTLKYKEHNYFESTMVISVLSALFTLFAILVALSTDNVSNASSVFIIVALLTYAIILGFSFTYATRKSMQLVRITNLLDIAISLKS